MEPEHITELLDESKGVDRATKKARDAAQTFWNSAAAPAINRAVEKAFTPEETQRRFILIRQLKNIYIHYPDINFENHENFENAMQELSTNDLQAKVRAAKDEIGVESPKITAKAIVVLIGGIFERFFGFKECTKEMEDDDELISAVEFYIPDLSEHMSLPMIILSRLFAHLTGRANKRKRVDLDDGDNPTKRRQGGVTTEPPK